MQKDLKDREDRIISREQSLKAEQKRYDGLLREVGEKRQKLEERLVQLRQERLTKEEKLKTVPEKQNKAIEETLQ